MQTIRSLFFGITAEVLEQRKDIDPKTLLQAADQLGVRGAQLDAALKAHGGKDAATLLEEACQTLTQPICAIGGITLDKAPALIAAGIDLIAVISDLFDAPDICARAAAYQSLFKD